MVDVLQLFQMQLNEWALKYFYHIMIAAYLKSPRNLNIFSNFQRLFDNLPYKSKHNKFGCRDNTVINVLTIALLMGCEVT